MLVTVHDAATGGRMTVFVDIDRDLPTSALIPALVSVTGADLSAVMRSIEINGRIIDPATPLRETGLQEGSAVTLLTATSISMPPTARSEPVQQIRVVSGAAAGTVYHCDPGVVSIGRSPHAQIIVTDRDAQEVDLGLVIDSAGAVTIATGEVDSPARVNGEPVSEQQPLTTGDQLVYADRVLQIGGLDATTAAIEDDPATGQRKYNRPPRMLPAEPNPLFRLPGEPREPDKQPLPILMSLLPLAMAVVMVYLYKNPIMLAFGIMSPVMLIGSYITGRKSGHRRFRRQTREYKELKAKIEADAQDALAQERVQRLNANPDPSLLASIATGPGPRLWERRVTDDSWLSLRFGTATQPSKVTLEDPEQLAHKQTVVWEIPGAPVTVNLAQAGVVGLAGATGRIEGARRIGQWLCAQVGVLHSPKDAHLYYLTAVPETATAPSTHPWDFLTWLPHTMAGLGQNTLRTIATTTAALATRLAELSQLLDTRQAALAQTGGSSFTGPSVVVILEGASRLRSMPGIVRVLKDGPRVGVYSICIERDERLLPEECDTVLVIGDGKGTLRRQKAATHLDLLPDWVSLDWLDWTARALAPIIDSSPSITDAAIPSSSRLLEVLQLDPPTTEAIQARWTLNPRSTVATIGESLDGTFSLDLVADGPHGLIGGTTGSGKSEFLQTIVASLAVANSPEEMNFVLIDYKGGAAFKDCEFLPHTVGMVTDLDTHLVERALDSLNAELRRREHLLAEAGAKDLEDYQDLTSRRNLPPIPRLLVVADEFASLIRELPDFVTGLVNLAQRGRSLGIHLLLATQRPGGSVSPEIRANTNLRIALRMTDGAESADVIDSPEAGTISKSNPGRAYARLGANSLIPFQAGRVGGRAPAITDLSAVKPDPLVRPAFFADLASAAPERPNADSGKGDVEVTDLRLLVAAIKDAHSALALPEQRKPWLPALPGALALSSLFEQFPSEGERREVCYGIEDHPSEQAQRPARIDPDDFGHQYVVGTARSGKTTALRTIAVSAATAFTTADLHLYVIDCGNGGLLPLAGFPHVGALVLRHQTDHVTRLLAKLRALVKQRQQALAAAGVSDLAELRRITSGEDRPAQTFLLIDSWDTFTNTFEDIDNGELIDTITFLLREGAAAGVHLIITGDRALIVSGRMSTLAENKLVLRLVEKSDFSLIGLNPRSLPETIGEGRGYSSGRCTETQVAIIEPQLTPQEQTAHIKHLGAKYTARDAHVPRKSRPFTIAEMPTRYAFHDTYHGVAETEPGDLFLGLGGEDVEPILINPRQRPGFVVAGHSGSGRSNTLHHLARRALARGYHLVVLAPRSSPLRALDGKPGVKAVLTGTSISQGDLEPHLTDVATPTLLIADDADLLRDIDADQWLRTLIPQAADLGLGFLLSGVPDDLSKGFSGWVKEVAKTRRGLVLAPREPLDGEVAGVKMSRSDVAASAVFPTGRGYSHGPDGSPVTIQIPHHPVTEGALP